MEEDMVNEKSFVLTVKLIDDESALLERNFDALVGDMVEFLEENYSSSLLKCDLSYIDEDELEHEVEEEVERKFEEED